MFGLLFKLANMVFGVGSIGAKYSVDWGTFQGGKYEAVMKFVNTVKIILIPLLIMVASAGTIYAVVLGVNMARADSGEKREEAKKRLVNFIIGFVIIIVLIVALRVIAEYIPNFLIDEKDFDSWVNKGSSSSQLSDQGIDYTGVTKS